LVLRHRGRSSQLLMSCSTPRGNTAFDYEAGRDEDLQLTTKAGGAARSWQTLSPRSTCQLEGSTASHQTCIWRPLHASHAHACWQRTTGEEHPTFKCRYGGPINGGMRAWDCALSTCRCNARCSQARADSLNPLSEQSLCQAQASRRASARACILATHCPSPSPDGCKSSRNRLLHDKAAATRDCCNSCLLGTPQSTCNEAQSMIGCGKCRGFQCLQAQQHGETAAIIPCWT
jgi:hypothetical protein